MSCSQQGQVGPSILSLLHCELLVDAWKLLTAWSRDRDLGSVQQFSRFPESAHPVQTTIYDLPHSSAF